MPICLQCVPSDVGLVRASITTSVSVRSGVTTMVATANTTLEQKKLVTDIFSLIGHCEMVEDENYVDYNSTYCGCGVAYVSTGDLVELMWDEVVVQMCVAIEAYADGGVLIGLQRKKALELAAKTMLVSYLSINWKSATQYISSQFTVFLYKYSCWKYCTLYNTLIVLLVDLVVRKTLADLASVSCY